MKGKKVGEIPIYVKQFNLIIDTEGLIRCQTRLPKANVNVIESAPLLIPTRSYFARLIIQESHERVFHNGIAQTLCRIRSKYWIPRLRQLVKGILRRCVICKRLEGKTYQSPPVPPLPNFRVSDSPPFSDAGLDFIGPLFIRTDDNTGTIKAYICLFTCCSTRGLHLELCKSLNLASFCLLFRRFCARREVSRRC